MTDDYSSCASDDDVAENSRTCGDGELLDLEDIGNVVALASKAKVYVLFIFCKQKQMHIV